MKLALLLGTTEGPTFIFCTARAFPRFLTQADPCISSVTTSIMITTSNSSRKRSGLLNQLLDVLLHTIAMSGLARVSVWACGPLNLMKISSSKCRIGQARSDEIEFALCLIPNSGYGERSHGGSTSSHAITCACRTNWRPCWKSATLNCPAWSRIFWVPVHAAC